MERASSLVNEHCCTTGKRNKNIGAGSSFEIENLLVFDGIVEVRKMSEKNRDKNIVSASTVRDVDLDVKVEEEIKMEEKQPCNAEVSEAKLSLNEEPSIDPSSFSPSKIEDFLPVNPPRTIHPSLLPSPIECVLSLLLEEQSTADPVVAPKRSSVVRRFQCYLCPFSAPNKSSLKIHFRKHSGEKPYKCPLCTYSASQEGNLRHHIRCHTGEKPFKCEVCTFSARQKGNLQRHFLRHHCQEKPFKCDMCTYATAIKSALQEHLRYHMADKPFKCEHCPFSTAHKGTLKRHIRTHNKEGSEESF